MDYNRVFYVSHDGLDRCFTTRIHMFSLIDDDHVCVTCSTGVVLYALRMNGSWHMHRLGGLPAITFSDYVGFFEYGVNKSICDITSLDELDKMVLALKYMPSNEHEWSNSFYVYKL